LNKKSFLSLDGIQKGTNFAYKWGNPTSTTPTTPKQIKNNKEKENA